MITRRPYYNGHRGSCQVCRVRTRDRPDSQNASRLLRSGERPTRYRELSERGFPQAFLCTRLSVARFWASPVAKGLERAFRRQGDFRPPGRSVNPCRTYSFAELRRL